MNGCASEEIKNEYDKNRMSSLERRPVRFVNTSCIYNPLDGECQYLDDKSLLCSMGQCNEGNCNTGKGKVSYPGCTTIEGVFKNGKIDGELDLIECGCGLHFIGVQKESTLKGKHIFPNGEIYEGTIIDGLKQGKGNYKDINGVTYNGNWKNNIREGRFTINDNQRGMKRIVTYINGKDDDERERERQKAIEDARQRSYEIAESKRREIVNLEWHRKFIACRVFRDYEQCNRNVPITFINSDGIKYQSLCGKTIRSERISFQCKVSGNPFGAIANPVVYLHYDEMGNCSNRAHDLCK
jgi:hypothetical protein